MLPSRHLLRGLLLLTLPALSACSTHDSRLNSSATRYLGTGGTPFISQENSIAESKSYWDGDGVAGDPSIVINVGRQTASFYKGDQLVAVSAISSGRDGHETPAGEYRIIEKKKDHRSNLYGNYVDAAGNVVKKGIGIKIDPQPPGTKFEGAPMPYWLRLTKSGIGLHQGFIPGVPDSRGCIRLPEKMARVYWENAPLGTPVTIVH